MTKRALEPRRVRLQLRDGVVITQGEDFADDVCWAIPFPSRHAVAYVPELDPDGSLGAMRETPHWSKRGRYGRGVSPPPPGGQAGVPRGPAPELGRMPSDPDKVARIFGQPQWVDKTMAANRRYSEKLASRGSARALL